MIEADGWETIYPVDIVRPAPFIERDIRVAIEKLRHQSHALDIARLPGYEPKPIWWSPDL